MSDLDNFRTLGVTEATIKALRAKGFEAPSPIQELTIPKLLSGECDLIGQAQTGTGKTAAFGIPIIELCKANSPKPQALVLAPTRELSIQIAEELNSLKGESKLRIAPFYGGQAIEIQLSRLRDGIDVVIGTPGRILDLMRRKKLDFSALKFAVLDEADEMLDMGFIEEIEAILSETTPEKRMLMFSATMPPEILKIAERFMCDYEVIRTESKQLSTDLTEQIYFEVRREDKFEALSRIIDVEEDIYALVFCRTRNDVDELVEKLKLRGHRVEALHGDIAQAMRTKVINQFKDKKFKILIATDVAARGIDVNDLTHVINYSMPQGTDTYVHRIGRTGRAGKTGTAITFVTPAEYRRLTMIQREAKTHIAKKELPQGKDVVEQKKQRFAELVAEAIEGGTHSEYLAFAEELMANSENPAEVMAAVLQLRFKGELLPENYRNFGQKNSDRRSWESMPDDHGATRLYIGVGKLDGYGAVKMLDLLWEKARLKKYRVGKIDCFDHFSFVNVDFEAAEQVIDAFRRGGPKVQLASERPEDGSKKAERTPRTERTERTERPERQARTERTEHRSHTQKEGTRKPKTPPAEKKRRLQSWVEKISGDIELKEKKSKKRK
ncbi:MAG: DEAD/DEAH box helicase [Victivallales bacterium]|jgi:ATP-dependent RNA helicase DeaD|nr:DEAD/DEAH box helicase [Victivallales bacterium]